MMQEKTNFELSIMALSTAASSTNSLLSGQGSQQSDVVVQGSHLHPGWQFRIEQLLEGNIRSFMHEIWRHPRLCDVDWCLW
jgi:hypothetical protein